MEIYSTSSLIAFFKWKIKQHGAFNHIFKFIHIIRPVVIIKKCESAILNSSGERFSLGASYAYKRHANNGIYSKLYHKGDRSIYETVNVIQILFNAKNKISGKIKNF